MSSLTSDDEHSGSSKRTLSIDEIRSRLQGRSGRKYWRSLEELAETEEFNDFLHREFPREASVWDSAVSRRQFLKVMGASLALAGLSACTRQPAEKIIPYVIPPENVVPGKPLSYASAHVMGGYALGILATSYQGRPTKIEGNPAHPASMGATDIFAQASILTLYDPDRSKMVTNNGNVKTWQDLTETLAPQLQALRKRRGAGLRILSPVITSPTFLDQINTFRSIFPDAKWHRYEPVMADGEMEGGRLAFGKPVETRYAFDKADVVLSLESDFLAGGPGGVRYGHDFAGARNVDTKKKGINRLYVVESAFSLTGANADHRLAIKASEVELFTRALAEELGIAGLSSSQAPGIPQDWISAVARDLVAHPGRTIVIPGAYQTAAVHALAHLINAKLGNVGATITYSDPVDPNPQPHLAALQELAGDINAGRVDTLFIFGSNPVYDAPVDLQFAELLKRVPNTIHLGLYDDETASNCHWHLPASHYLESWSDARAYDGTVSIVQPLIEPLYESRSVHDIMSIINTGREQPDYDIVRNYWREKGNLPAPFDASWSKALSDGLIASSSFPARTFTPTPGAIPNGTNGSSNGNTQGGFEIVFRPDPTIWDGRFCNNGWLQELPKPISKLTWDNAAMISLNDADRLGIETEDLVDIHIGDRSLRVPVWVLPGQAAGVVTLFLGYGRSRTGSVGTGTGFNTYALRTSAHPWFEDGATITKAGSKYTLANTQGHFNMEGRHVLRTGTLEEFLGNPKFAQEMEEEPPRDLTLYPEWKYDQYAWGMSIDLNACIGCGACTIACQSENNIPIVGKEQVSKSREMHWIRVDRYFEGNPNDPELHFMPVPCMHCENAPCELVCPVQATVHDAEGLNVMVYNRCIGTRYCSNNCPYKVRRFNFLQYADDIHPTVMMQKNPEVSVRERGVMEKCTYCVQRISAGRIEAKKEDRQIRDGEVVTACQQVCPANAIVFGNINDRSSEVARMKANPRNYGLLADLNTRPRTTYLARVRNVNPEVEKIERSMSHA